MGTDEDMVNRIIGGSGKPLVKKIAQRYFEKYDKNLAMVLGGIQQTIVSVSMCNFVDIY